MTMTAAALLDIAVWIGFAMLLAALAAAFARMVLGPTLTDRVVALDLLTFLLAAFAALYAVAADEPAFLDIALALALVGFLATVALARYVERRDPAQPLARTRRRGTAEDRR